MAKPLSGKRLANGLFLNFKANGTKTPGKLSKFKRSLRKLGF